MDARHLNSLMKERYGYKGDILISEQATKAAVVEKLMAGLESTAEDGLFLFFYSGHGGQEYLGGKEPDGADRMDEYLCLYDSHMLDDEIWDLVCRCRGRVFLYFDACHSATMYRTVAGTPRNPDASNANALAVDPSELVKSKGFTFRPFRNVKAKALSTDGRASPKILCWSGCKEVEYSYGGSRGGYLTICVLNNWKKGCTYGELWKKASQGVKDMEPTQNPVETYFGGGFSSDMEAFR
jgi:hypothetical protein